MNIFEHLQCKDRLRILNVVLNVSSDISVDDRLVLSRCSRLCIFIVQDVFYRYLPLKSNSFLHPYA